MLALFSQGILRRLDEIAKRLEAVEAELKALREEARRGRASRGGQMRRNRGADALLEYLEKHRYLAASEARGKLGLSTSRLLDAAEEIGAEVIEAGGDLVVILPQYLEEFDALLAEAGSPDPAEAADSMGIYKKLFEKLLKAGLLYYDAASRGWKRI